MNTATTVLAASGMAAGYHGHPVVRSFDLELRGGEVCALLGPNGAGKTTTLLALAGELPLLAGEVSLLGHRTTAPLHRRARAGLSLVTEERSVFKSLSVTDNLRAGDAPVADAVALFPELEPLLRRRAGLLSGGEQQMLTLARALARRPKVLLVDELSLGLAPLVVRRLLQVLRQAASETGLAVLLVEQHVHQALQAADHIMVMRGGHVVLRGPAASFTGRLSEIEAAYLSAEGAAPVLAGNGTGGHHS